MGKLALTLCALLLAWPAGALGTRSPSGPGGRIADDIDLPFVDDPAVVGTWRSVDFVKEPPAFTPGLRSWRGGLYLKELVFLPGGKSPNAWLTWTKGVLLHHGDRTASRYELKKLDGHEYMFLEWKSGDYTLKHRKPEYYVLEKIAGIRLDNIDLPFVNDPAVLGEWRSVDFVRTPEEFRPSSRAWTGPLYLKKLVFLPGGKGGDPWWTWTKGYVLHHGDHTSSAYTIKKMDGAEYMFFQWKSGDYVFRGAKPFYYVLKKE